MWEGDFPHAVSMRFRCQRQCFRNIADVAFECRRHCDEKWAIVSLDVAHLEMRNAGERGIMT